MILYKDFINESIKYSHQEIKASLDFIKTLPKFIGKGYRHDGSFTPSGSAGDVVRYESDELENDNKVDPKVMPYLDTIPASRLKWVTKNRKDVTYYKDYGELMILQLNGYIVGCDEQGGYLVLELIN